VETAGVGFRRSLTLMKKNHSTDTSPLKLVSDELTCLRKVFRETVQSYGRRLDAEIVQVREAVEEVCEAKKVSAAQHRDARDMLTILRGMRVKTEKGRRRDLKRLESLVEDLIELSRNW
jgi:hypothetical protein